MMKTLPFIFALLFGFNVFAQSISNTEEEQIQQLIQNSFDEIFSSYQIEKLSDFYTEDFLLLEQGEVWDLPVIRNYLTEAQKKPNPPIRTNRFDFIKTEIAGDRAWVAYHNYATISRDGQVLREIYWLESATAIKTKNGWRLDMLHSTRVEKQ
jgi:ketosteroid isomerase-like protein